ncbi:hypothetical protein [Candidatus Nitrotoga sp. M5]|uniref:hypothetical protein n=1 Tax=Candidatus Nitrotoga sp. M5 TaxID=2890409 RepID=UPI001EF340FA|nr:hypothetical protein [Candidatus Nitrotoga sp. M5]CAH1386560.1 membrane hypothetical protein [Candidatus Nitrotoga sp. M5]
MLRAFLSATGALILGIVVYYVVIGFVCNEFVMFLGWCIPLIGAAVAAFLAPRNKFKVGATTFIPAILVVSIGGYIAGTFGFGDFIGIESTFFAMLLSAPFIALASGCGALLGEWVSKGGANT